MRPVTILAVTLATLLATACGGGGSGASASTQRTGTLRISNMGTSTCIVKVLVLGDEQDRTSDDVLDLLPGDDVDLDVPAGLWDLFFPTSRGPSTCRGDFKFDVEVREGELTEASFFMHR